MTELKNYVELEHIATGYPVVIALNSKECQLLSHYYNIRQDEYGKTIISDNQGYTIAS